MTEEFIAIEKLLDTIHACIVVGHTFGEGWHLVQRRALATRDTL